MLTIARFCHIISAFHPEAGESSVGDKCHQLRCLISSVNDDSIKTFGLVPTSEFDEGCIATCSCIFCVRQYNKYKPDKFWIKFFFLDDITHWFIRHVRVYQVNNAGNIYVYEIYTNLPTTIKAGVNGIIVAGVGNGPNSSRKLFLDHHYACPNLLIILEKELSVLAGCTCWNSSNGCPGKYYRITIPRGGV